MPNVNSTFFNRNVPDECHDKMKAFLAAGHKIVAVAFPPAGGNSWSVVTDKTFFNRNVPDECHDKMKALAAAGNKVSSVAFPKSGGNRWSVVANNAFFNRQIPDECHRVMRAITGCGMGPLRGVAFHPDAGFCILAKADAIYADPQLSEGNEHFSLTKFADNLRAQLHGKGCKYGIMVRLGSALRTATDGPKRTTSSPPAQEFTLFDRFNPASVAKTVTAVALLQLLEKKGLEIEEPIGKHLPSSWTIGPNVDTITVKELLNHSSGFRGGVAKYDDLKKLVEAGVELADKVDSYQNCNSSVARIVVAFLSGNNENLPDQGKVTSENFISCVQKNIFDPLGTLEVQWKPDAVAPTLFYPTPPGSSGGTTYGDRSLRPGSDGVHLSLAELSIFLRSLSESNTLLTSGMRSQMDTHGLGWGKIEDVEKGWYHRKRGYFPAANNGGAELNSGIYKFSSGVQVVVLHNGSGGVNVAKAYDDAWFVK